MQNKQNDNTDMDEKTSARRDPTEPIRPRRPIVLTLIMWIFVLWTVLGWLRFFEAVANQGLISEFLQDWVFWYLLAAGLIWGLTGIPVIWGLLRGAGWTLKLLPIAATIYPLSYWLERLLLWRQPQEQGNWLFMLLLSGLWLGLVVWGMLSEKVRRFFKHTKERK